MKLRKKAKPVVEQITALERIGGVLLREPAPCVTTWGGTADYDTLLIAPPPTEAEFSANHPWAAPEAGIFCNIMAPLLDRCLVMPCVFHGVLDKKSGRPVADLKQGPANFARQTLQAILKDGHTKRIVCIGSHTFKLHFGMGRKPSMNSLAGTTVRLPVTDMLPVFTMPDPELLHLDPTAYSKGSRNAYLAGENNKRALAWFMRLRQPFEQFIKA